MLEDGRKEELKLLGTLSSRTPKSMHPGPAWKKLADKARFIAVQRRELPLLGAPIEKILDDPNKKLIGDKISQNVG